MVSSMRESRRCKSDSVCMGVDSSCVNAERMSVCADEEDESEEEDDEDEEEEEEETEEEEEE